MKHLFITLGISLAYFVNAQSLYVKNFGTSYGPWTFSAFFPSEVSDDGGTTTRACTFTNGPIANDNYAKYTRTNLYDPNAINYDYAWDSIVFMFKYRTTGYARDFRIIFDYLVGAGSYEYDIQRNFFQPDTENVKIVVSGPTMYAVNCEIGLIKTDTTLNNFKVYLSNLSIKGYITYMATGLSEQSNSQEAIFYNNETLFFPEKWLNKRYWITDVLGKEYVSGIVSSDEEKINLENGLYVLRTETSIQKILIAR